MSTSRTNKEKLYDVIKKPLITEKSYKAMQDGQYTFEVVKDATKVELKILTILINNFFKQHNT